MKWLKAFWAGILAFFASYKADEDAAHQEAQEAQDQIVEETQDEIDQIPDKTDAELLNIAVNSGLVRRDADPGSGASGPFDLGTGDGDFSGRKPGSSFTAKK